MIIDEVANHFEISHGSAYDTIHNRLGFRKVCARWVPKELTEDHRNNRVVICQRLLDRYANEGEAFLTRIVTGDETWSIILHRKAKARAWNGNIRDHQ